MSATPSTHSSHEARSRLATWLAFALLAAAVVSLPFLVAGQEREGESTQDARGAAEEGPAGEDAPATTQEETLGMGADTFEVPVLDCKAVRKDVGEGDEPYQVPMPPFSPNIFPCTRCHDKPDDFNLTKRNLTLEHTGITLIHGPREQWCYGCHNPQNRDMLRLAGGRLVSFRRSYELCGQCHGPKLRDWRLGIHGRRTGCWNGKYEYRLCVHCHNPHAPKFGALAPKPRPRKPSEIRFHPERGKAQP